MCNIPQADAEHGLFTIDTSFQDYFDDEIETARGRGVLCGGQASPAALPYGWGSCSASTIMM
jgi:hypothetical protein